VHVLCSFLSFFCFIGYIDISMQNYTKVGFVKTRAPEPEEVVEMVTISSGTTTARA